MPFDPTIYRRPAELLQQLIRFDTTNPPGSEADCVAFIDRLLRGAGIETRTLTQTPGRPNLVARLPGRGAAPPLLLHGHVDVVTTGGQSWRHPPFAGELRDGWVWGRGALDMKGGVAMLLSAFLRAKAEGFEPPGDLVLLILSDEEAGGDDGARFLAEQHPELFQGVKYAVGEFGGFPLYLGGRKFYLVQVAEKQMCWMKATLKGPGGHGAFPVRDGAMAKLGALLGGLNRRLPAHHTPIVTRMLEEMAEALDAPWDETFRALLDPQRTDAALDRLGPTARFFDSLLHHTVSPTILHGGDKINVIPGAVSVELDGRLLPGCEPRDLMDEIRALVGDEVELELIRHDPGPAEADMGLFALMGDLLREADPEGIPVPLLMPGVTDGRFFARLGIQPYGFLPMNLPEGFNFLETVHAADERVPAEAISFGAEALYGLFQRFGD